MTGGCDRAAVIRCSCIDLDGLMQLHVIRCRCIEPARIAPWPRALKLISHKLCPYVQRAVIALTEKGVPFERIDIDLANKPDWFLKISPLGKTPVLLGRRRGDFRDQPSSCEYLEETQPEPAASAPIRLSAREHRAWIEFGSAVLNDIAGFYARQDEATFESQAAAQLEQSLRGVEAARRGVAVVRRRKLSAWSTRCSAGVPLFRRVRRDRRSRHSCRTSRSFAHGAGAGGAAERARAVSAPTIRRCCAP